MTRPKYRNPRRASLDDGACRIIHREFVGNVSGTALFAATKFPIQPAVNSLFPWLSNIAPSYESYIFHSLKFIYQPTCSTATAGTAILTVDYDAADPGPVTKPQALAYHNAVRCAAWSEAVFIADRRDLRKLPMRYTRPGILPASTDIKTYDVGNLFVCTDGFAVTNAVGEIYVDFDIELQTPQLADGLPAPTNIAFNALNSPAVATKNQPLLGAAIAGGLPIRLDNTDSTKSKLIFDQAMEVLLSYKETGGAGITGPPDWVFGSVPFTTDIPSFVSPGATSLTESIRLKPQPGDVISLTNSGKCTAAPGMDMMFTLYPYSFA